jgi:hypothetical protein
MVTLCNKIYYIMRVLLIFGRGYLIQIDSIYDFKTYGEEICIYEVNFIGKHRLKL